MSVGIMTAAWTVDLHPGDKLVLLALADCANDEGHCWPGLASLCRKTGKCKRSLQEALRVLDKAGHITRIENPGKGMNYTVHPVAENATRGKTCTGSKNTPKPVAKSAPKPLRTIKSSEAKASSPRAKFPAPPGVSDEQWVPFCAQRKKPHNERSYLLLCNKLLKVSAETGWPPGDLIDLATERGWETVFAPRNFDNDRSKPSPLDQLVAASLGGCFGTGENPETLGSSEHGFSGPTGLARIGSGRA
jgi:hypothetical protein